MKKILGYTVIFLLIGTGMQAQDFDLGDIMGEAQDFFGEAQDDAEKAAADTDATRKFKEAFQNSFTEYVNYINDLDDYLPETKCLYIMLKYKSEFDALTGEIQSTSDCRKKYDLYGMKLMMMMSSTTIMYCTEDLWNLISSFDWETQDKPSALVDLDTELFEIVKKYDDYLALLNREGGVEDDELFPAYADLTDSDLDITIIEEFYEETLKDNKEEYQNKDGNGSFALPIGIILNKYFEPGNLLKNTLEISKEMDALKPCTGY